MHKLYIKDSSGSIPGWWINFLTASSRGAKIIDIEGELQKWNAKSHSDAVEFDTAEDMAWFLLRYS